MTDQGKPDRWHETETNILQVHAFFGGKLCWLKNGEIKCGMPYDNPIHELEVEPCDHSFVCEKCGEIHDSSPVPAAAPQAESVPSGKDVAQQWLNNKLGCPFTEQHNFIDHNGHNWNLAELLNEFAELQKDKQ